MKQEFRQIFESRMFNAILGMVLFMMLALGYDYSIDETFTTKSLLYDIGFCLILGVLLLILPNNKKIDKKIVKDRSETFELFGKVFIGILLFIVLLTLMLIH